jgi:hypothetical protein
MTQTPPAAPDPGAVGAKVTDLEKQLADAAAQVAKVQAELSEARAADPNHPQVAVPYAGNAPVVMINGQQVPGGQAIDLSAMLGGFFGGAGAAGATAAAGGAAQVINIPPVVSLNGQVVSGGQPVDLSAILGAEGAAHVRSSLEQLGLGGQFGGLFGGPVSTTTPSASPPPSFTQPGPAAAMPYTTTPGEVTGSGSKALVWLAAALVIGLIGVIVYLVVTG